MNPMRTLCGISAVAVLSVALIAAQQAPPSKTAPAKPAEQREAGLYMTFQTEKGSITCKIFENDTPATAHKIVGLAVGKIGGKRFYDGLIFHRIIPGFMIQGGDPLGTGMGGPKGPGFPFKDEFVPTLRFDVPGRLAMANSGPNTNGSQFFITDVPTPHLNNRHTIFGQCGNIDVVKTITRVPRDNQDRPLMPVHIQKVVVERVGPVPPDAPETLPARKAPGKTPGKSAGKAPSKSRP